MLLLTFLPHRSRIMQKQITAICLAGGVDGGGCTLRAVSGCESFAKWQHFVRQTGSISLAAFYRSMLIISYHSKTSVDSKLFDRMVLSLTESTGLHSSYIFFLTLEFFAPSENGILLCIAGKPNNSH